MLGATASVSKRREVNAKTFMVAEPQRS